MDTAITEQSLRLMEELHRAIPSLMASSDFVGNLENSLRILGRTLSLDLVFVSVAKPEERAHGISLPGLRTPVVLEQSNGRWRELMDRKTEPAPFTYKPEVLLRLKEESFVLGAYADLFERTTIEWQPADRHLVQLLPLRVNGQLKGVLGLGKKEGNGSVLGKQVRTLKIYTSTLAHWLERYELFRLVRSERDHLRDVLNMGESAENSRLDQNPKWEHSIMDAQLLNRKIVTTIPDQVFIVDLQDHSNLYSNRPTFLGYTLDDIDDPFEFFQRLIHPDDFVASFEHFFEKLSRAADDDIIESEYRMYANSGELLWFHQRVKVFKRDKAGKVKQYLSVLQDITSRKQALMAKEQSRQRYKNFVTYSTEGIYYMNCGVPIPTDLPPEEQVELYYRHAYIDEANQAIAKMYNLKDKSELIGRRVMDLHQGEHFEQNQESFLRFIQNNYRVEQIETIEKAADGRKCYFLNNAVGAIEDGKLVGIWGTQRDITAKREAESARQESDILFRNLFEKNPLGVVIGNPQGDLLRCNDRFAKMLDYTVQELEQMTFMEITHPDEVTEEFQKVENAVSIGLPIMLMNKRYLNRAGEVIWANVSMSLLYHPDGRLRLLMAMIEDITEKRKIWLKLEKSEAFQKAILSTLPDLKFRISKAGIYVDYYPSPNHKQNLLVPPEAFIGKSVHEVLPGYLADASMTNIKKAIETRELQSFEYMLPVNGDMLHFETRINAINEEEVVAIVRDVSERNWAQVELKTKVRELDEKNRQLKDYIDSNMQLENFAYIASHDLREPLRTMGTFAKLLEKKYAKDLDETAQTYINFIVQGSKNLNNLIEDLLTYSRIQNQENRRENIAPADLLREVMEGLKGSIEENNARIRFRELPASVSANSSRLKQLFQNLLSNAIKFRKPGQPVEVEIACRDRGQVWEFEVRDNGIGVDPEFHEKIFLLFKKLHSRKDFQGTGLGLAICKKVVDQMGGEIWVESLSGQGASFFFTMPK